MNTRREESGAHRAERGRQGWQERGTRGPHARRRRRQQRTCEGGEEGRRDGQTAPKAGEGGRLRVPGAQGGVPGGQEPGKPPGRSPGGLGVVLKFGAGGLWIRKGQRG